MNAICLTVYVNNILGKILLQYVSGVHYCIYAYQTYLICEFHEHAQEDCRLPVHHNML